MHRVGLALACILIAFQGWSAKITIQAPEYAGSTFNFYTIPNFLTDRHEIVGEGTVSDNGAMSIDLNVSQTMAVYTDFGVYKGWFIAEPNGTFEIALPPKEEKTTTNPYFKPKLVQLDLKNMPDDATNTLVAMFDKRYNAEMSKNMNQIFYRRSVETAEAMIAGLKEVFLETKNEYFEQHKLYRYGYAKYMAMINNATPVMQEYMVGKPILYYHPEYSLLFDKLFSKHLQYATQAANGQKIAMLINSGASEQLMEWLTEDIHGDPNLAEAVMLMGMKPIFYSKKFNVNGLFSILQSISEKSKVPTHKETADKISAELARTMYGTKAPELSLLDIDGNMVELSNFEGRYIYLCFTRTDNSTFQIHKELLQKLNLAFPDDLDIVLVLENDNIDEVRDRLVPEDFTWTVLRGATRKAIYESFKVRTMPTYFLIDPEGRMAGSLAPWPDENFDLYFAKVLQSTKE